MWVYIYLGKESVYQEKEEESQGEEQMRGFMDKHAIFPAGRDHTGVGIVKLKYRETQ